MAKQSPDSPISQRKKLVFSLILVLIPLVFFLILEFVLRLVSYGPDLRLFKTQVISGKTYHIMNPEVKSRYFHQVDFSPSTSPEYFLMPKPAGTFRIFCLGGSTTVGYPYWYNGSFSSFLRDRLQATFPQRPVEVINLGMTATNSFTALDIAQEIVDYEPDLILVYDGHNEFYGALGVASNESVGSSRWATLLYLKLVHVRTFLLIRDMLSTVLHWFGKSEAPVSRTGTMMEQMAVGQYIDYRDGRYRKALDAFQENVRDLMDLCVSRSIPLLLGTQVSNLKDQVPFISSDHAMLSPQERETFRNRLAEARERFSAGEVDTCLGILADLIRTDSLDAASWYLLGKCREKTGEYQIAKDAFVHARDYDRLRFRMSSDFNKVLVDTKTPPLIGVADMEELFARESPHGLIGNELITEHLHPNARGYFLMAKEYARCIRSMGLLAPDVEWTANDTISDATFWATRNVTELDEMIAERRTEILTSGWPFRDQYPIVDPVDEADTLRSIAEKATRGEWDWKKVHEEAAGYYERNQVWDKAEKEYLALINQIPLDVTGFLNLAHLYVNRNQIFKARQVLMLSLKVQETPLAYRALGDIALRSGRAADAVGHYEHLLQFPQTAPEQDENGYLLSLAYLQANNPDAAVRQLEKLLHDNPANTQASTLLNRIKELRSQLPGR